MTSEEALAIDDLLRDSLKMPCSIPDVVSVVYCLHALVRAVCALEETINHARLFDTGKVLR